MVTLSQLQQQEQELSQAEKEQQRLASKKIPQRKFGSKVTRGQQKKVIQERIKARESLSEIKQRRGQLTQDIKRERIRQDVLVKLNKIATGGKVIFKGEQRVVARQILSESPEIAQAVKQGREFRASKKIRQRRLQQFQSQGLSPIVNNEGRVVGFLDFERKQTIPIENIPDIALSSQRDLRRFEKAGIISTDEVQSRAFIPPTEREEALQQSLAVAEERFETPQSLARKEDVVLAQRRTPRGRVGLFLERPEREIKSVITDIGGRFEKAGGRAIVSPFGTFGTPSPIAFILGSKDTQEINQVAGKTIILSPKASRQTLETSLDVLTFTTPPFAVARGTTFVSSIIGRELKGEQVPKIEKISALGIGGIGVLRLTSKLNLTSPVIIKKDPVVTPLLKSNAEVLNVRAGEIAGVDIARFVLRGVKPERKAFVVPKISLITKRISPFREQIPKDLSKLSTKELKFLFPRGKEVVIEKARFTIATTEPFIIKGGKVARSLTLDRKSVGLLIKSATLTRQSPLRLARLEGGFRRGSRKVTTLDVSKLSTRERKLFEESTGLVFGKGRKPVISELFKKDTEFQTGSVLTKDLAKITRVGKVIPTPKGIRISRGEIGLIQENIASIKFDRRLGIQEIEKISERIAVADVTKTLSPRKVQPVISDLTRITLEIPETTKLPRFIKGVKGNRKKLITDNKRALQEIQAGASLQVVKQLKTKPLSVKQIKLAEQTRISKLPKIVGGGGKGVSGFAGLGKFEVTTATVSPSIQKAIPNLSKSIVSPKLKPLTLNVSSIKPASISISRQLPRGVTREVTREITRQVPRQIPRLIPRQVARQTPRQIPRLIPRVLPRITPPKTRGVKGLPKPKGIRFVLPPKISIPELTPPKQDLNIGFRTFVIKGGKKVFLEGVRPRGRALRVGATEVQQSLRATFGIERTPFKVTQKDIAFKPSKQVFREARIVRGRRVPTPNVFIQRRGQRLASASEVKSIQKALRISR